MVPRHRRGAREHPVRGLATRPARHLVAFRRDVRPGLGDSHHGLRRAERPRSAPGGGRAGGRDVTEHQAGAPRRKHRDASPPGAAGHRAVHLGYRLRGRRGGGGHHAERLEVPGDAVADPEHPEGEAREDGAVAEFAQDAQPGRRDRYERQTRRTHTDRHGDFRSTNATDDPVERGDARGERFPAVQRHGEQDSGDDVRGPLGEGPAGRAPDPARLLHGVRPREPVLPARRAPELLRDGVPVPGIRRDPHRVPRGGPRVARRGARRAEV